MSSEHEGKGSDRLGFYAEKPRRILEDLAGAGGMLRGGRGAKFVITERGPVDGQARLPSGGSARVGLLRTSGRLPRAARAALADGLVSLYVDVIGGSRQGTLRGFGRFEEDGRLELRFGGARPEDAELIAGLQRGARGLRFPDPPIGAVFSVRWSHGPS